MKPTVYVQMNRQPALTDGLRVIMEGFGGKPVEKLVDDHDVEADLAIVNSIEDALRALKETERTIIYVGCLPREDAEVSTFAARFPERIRHWPIVEKEGEENVVLTIKRAIEKMAKEKTE